MSDAVGDPSSAPREGGVGAPVPDDVELPMRNRRVRKRGIGLRGPLALAAALAAGLALSFVAFAAGISDASPPADPKAEGIVVLGQVKKGVPASELRVGMEMQLAVDTLYADDDHTYLVYVWEPAGARAAESGEA